MIRILQLAMLATAIAVGTVVLGWLAVPVVAASWGAVAHRHRGAALTAGVAAILAWGALLGIDALRGPVGTLAGTLGGVFSVRAVGVVAVTLALPGLLAVTSALVARSLLTLRR